MIPVSYPPVDDDDGCNNFIVPCSHRHRLAHDTCIITCPTDPPRARASSNRSVSMVGSTLSRPSPLLSPPGLMNSLSLSSFLGAISSTHAMKEEYLVCDHTSRLFSLSLTTLSSGWVLADYGNFRFPIIVEYFTLCVSFFWFPYTI